MPDNNVNKRMRVTTVIPKSMPPQKTNSIALWTATLQEGTVLRKQKARLSVIPEKPVHSPVINRVLTFSSCTLLHPTVLWNWKISQLKQWHRESLRAKRIEHPRRLMIQQLLQLPRTKLMPTSDAVAKKKNPHHQLQQRMREVHPLLLCVQRQARRKLHPLLL